jgi:hypothetical protein
MVLGPYTVRQSDINNLEKRLLEDCQAAGFLDELPATKSEMNLIRTWQWIADNAYISTDYTFLVLVDLINAHQFDLDALGRLFSRARQLEGSWHEHRLRLFHMFVGYWDNSELARHFHDINISFPYTVGDNYAVWEGISRKEMINLVGETRVRESEPIYGKTLFELTAGHPAAALDILERLNPKDMCIRTLLSATHQAAVNGPAGQALLETWLQLPSDSLTILEELALRQHVPIQSLRNHWRQLRVAGAVRCHQVGERHYLSFQSWYVDLLTRLHAEEIGVDDEQINRIRMNELMPTICELNAQAYRLINDIENQARNFVAIQLSLKQSKGHILAGRCQRFNEETNSSEDVYQRASHWRGQSLDKGRLNPLLAYVSTRDLARVIEEIGRDMNSEAWQHIADAIMELSDIRDAVMHNQLIDEPALRRLYELRADIYAALSEC